MPGDPSGLRDTKMEMIVNALGAATISLGWLEVYSAEAATARRHVNGSLHWAEPQLEAAGSDIQAQLRLERGPQ